MIKISLNFSKKEIYTALGQILNSKIENLHTETMIDLVAKEDQLQAFIFPKKSGLFKKKIFDLSAQTQNISLV